MEKQKGNNFPGDIKKVSQALFLGFSKLRKFALTNKKKKKERTSNVNNQINLTLYRQHFIVNFLYNTKLIFLYHFYI